MAASLARRGTIGDQLAIAPLAPSHVNGIANDVATNPADSRLLQKFCENRDVLVADWPDIKRRQRLPDLVRQHHATLHFVVCKSVADVGIAPESDECIRDDG